MAGTVRLMRELTLKEGTPIAELELYGLPVRLVNEIEDRYGLIYIRQFHTISVFDILAMGPVNGVKIAKALANFMDNKRVKTEAECKCP